MCRPAYGGSGGSAAAPAATDVPWSEPASSSTDFPLRPAPLLTTEAEEEDMENPRLKALYHVVQNAIVSGLQEKQAELA